MANTQTLDGLYKQVYGDKIKTLVPASAVLQKLIPFSQKTMELGNFYNQPVVLGQEQGITYFAPDTAVPTLSGSIDMTMKNAQILGVGIAGQSQLTVEAAMRAVSKGPAAFEDAVGLQMRNLKDSITKRTEFSMLYGQSGLATAATRANVNATTTNITITLSQWAAGLWSGLVNARLDAYQAGAYGSQTLINSVGPLTVSAVNTDTRVVTITGAAGDITALDTYVAANANLGEFYFRGAYNNEMAGLKRQLTKTTTLFNINPATYDLWRGNTYTVLTPFALTFKEIQKAVAIATARGLDEDAVVLVNPSTWANLLSDQAALRQYVGSDFGSAFKNGAEELTFFSQNGKLTIKPHIFVKEGDAFVFPVSPLIRVGATDITFDLPGTEKGRVFIQLASALGFEYRCYTNQALFLSTPARAVYVNGIVN